MAQSAYKITLERENLPPRQMAKVSMTLPSDMLLDLVKSMFDVRGKKNYLLDQLGIDQGSFGTLKSLTIVRVETSDA